MADPIISGREELGFSKLFCDLPSPIEHDGRFLCRASWDGHEFASLDLAGLSAGAPPPEAAVPPSEGLLHYRYVPRVGAPGEADARSEEHTSELQSLMRISYAVFCLKKKHKQPDTYNTAIQSTVVHRH